MIATEIQPDPALPLPLQQSPAYASTLAAMGQPACHMAAGGGIALLARAAGLVATIRGPFWATGADPDTQTAALRALNLRMIEAEAAITALPRAGFSQVFSPSHVAEWHLDHPPAARRAALHGKWRNALVRAESAGLKVTEAPFDPAPGHWLLTNTRALARARGYRALPQFFTQAYVAANPGQARLWAVWDGRIPLAGMVFLRHGPVATYHLGWTSAAGRATCAHHLLLARAADWLADRGHRRLDLGTLDTEAAPGLARFKLGTGAVARQLGGAWLRLPGLSCFTSALAKGRA